MKLKNLLISSAIALGLVASAGVALSLHNEANNVKAESTSGTLVAKLGNLGKWSESGAKLCAYMTDDSSSYWTSLQSLDGEKQIYLLDYTIEFTPTKLIFVRMNPAASSGNWDQKWNQTGDLGWNEATYIGDDWNPSAAQCSQWTVSAQVRSSTVPEFGTKQTLSEISLADVGDPQVHGKVALEKDEEFKILSGDGKWSGFYGCPEGLDDYFEGGSKDHVDNDNPNIVCKLAGTYDFYFNSETKYLWITNDALIEADGWAREFLADVKCDATSATIPTGWSTSAAYYASNLSGDAKDYVYALSADEEGELVAQALARYDVAVSRHSELDRFVKDSHNNVRTAHLVFNPHAGYEIESSRTLTIVVIATVIAATSLIGVTLIIKKRKAQ